MKRDVAQSLKPVVSSVSDRRVAVQAGGALGIFPKYLSERFETVYTFEPDPENFATMCRNAPERNIVKFQAALGCRRDLVRISHERRSRKPGTSHEGIRHVDGPGPIPTLLIDDLNLSVCNLLYLDIEGHELYALRGATETIARCRPMIAVEINEMVTYVGETEASIRVQMAAFDYVYHQSVGSSDHVFIPQERAA
jgi:FkbM family methyltransferase